MWADSPDSMAEPLEEVCQVVRGQRHGEDGGLSVTVGPHDFDQQAGPAVVHEAQGTPKGHRSDPYKPSKLVVVVSDLTSRIVHGLQFQQLTKVDVDGVARNWKCMWSGMDWTGPYTGHSVKRGALGHILRAMVAGVQVHEELVSRVCKHATLAGLLNQTIRYGSGTKADLISLAHASAWRQ